MKLTSIAITITSLLLAGGTGFGQVKHDGDPLAKHLLPPALIVSKAEAIGLTPDQHAKIKEITQQVHRDIAEPKKALDAARQALSEELAKSPLDADAALGKLDALLDLERAIKRLHLKMLVATNAELEPGQRAKLKAMSHRKPKEPAQVAEKRLKGKIARLQKIAEGLAAQGQSPEHIHEMMKGFTKHMEKGQVEQAEQLLDATLKKLRGEDENGSEGAAIDPDAIRKEVGSLRVAEVAWRKIPWKTCLIDALNASREQNKPIALWMFIDRPVDDKRC